MSRPTQNNRYHETEANPRFTIKGVNVVRLLVGLLLVLNFFLIYAIVFSSNGLIGYRKQNEQVREIEEKLLKLKADRIEHWLKAGAKPSQTVAMLLKKAKAQQPAEQKR